MAADGDDVGRRIEDVLEELRSRYGDGALLAGEQLVGMLVEYYGDGLHRTVALLSEQHPELLRRMAADPVLEGQLILHGLHPLGLDERIEAALDRVRPYLGSHAGGVAYLGTDDEGVAHLRLDGNCNGCASSTVTVRTTIEQAVLGAAPELAGVAVEGQVERPALLQIGMGPGAQGRPAGERVR